MRPLTRWLLGGLVAVNLGCTPEPSGSAASPQAPRRPPPRPGESITHTQMCSCLVCEPVSCCHELDADAPEVQTDCADGYDFSKCEMAVSSCDSNCFQHRWRARVEIGCLASRPDKCCHGEGAP